MSRFSPRRSARRRQRAATLLAAAQLGYAHWFFGNLYEAVVRIPHRLSLSDGLGGQDQRLRSLLEPGSPVRYFLPGVPVVIGATLGAVVLGWTSRDERPWLCAAGLSTMAGVAATGYLVRMVNLRLFVTGEAVSPTERERLLRTWYRLNAARLVTTGIAWLVAERLRSRLAR
jgi:hypothetical protein